MHVRIVSGALDKIVERGILNPMPQKDKQAYNAYMREYILKKYHRRMAEAKQQFGNKCIVCGFTEDLEFDHIDPDKKSFTIGKMWSLSNAKLQIELAKCQLLCGPCHDDKHKSEYPCGTAQKYWRGCRCKLCTTANSEYSYQYKQARASSSTARMRDF